MSSAGHRLLELLRSEMNDSHQPSRLSREGFTISATSSRFPFRPKAGEPRSVLPVTAIQDALH